MKITVVYTSAVQVTEDNYKLRSISKVFDDSASIATVMQWAKSQNRHALFNELTFVECVE